MIIIRFLISSEEDSWIIPIGSYIDLDFE